MEKIPSESSGGATQLWSTMQVEPGAPKTQYSGSPETETAMWPPATSGAPKTQYSGSPETETAMWPPATSSVHDESYGTLITTHNNSMKDGEASDVKDHGELTNTTRGVVGGASGGLESQSSKRGSTLGDEVSLDNDCGTASPVAMMEVRLDPAAMMEEAVAQPEGARSTGLMVAGSATAPARHGSGQDSGAARLNSTPTAVAVAPMPDRRVSEGAPTNARSGGETPERLASAPIMVVQRRGDSNTSHGSMAHPLHSGGASASSDAPRTLWASPDTDQTLGARSVTPSSMGEIISSPAVPTIPSPTTGEHSSRPRADDTTPRSRMRTSSSVVSSRIISSTPLEVDALQQRTRVVEVPVVEEVTKHVHVRRIVERERHIPQIERTEVKKTIDIPRINIVQKTVETPVIHEVVTTVPVKKVVEVSRESYQHVPKLETRMIEKEVDVIGDVIEVPKSFLVENRVIVPRFVDVPVPTVVSQTLQTKFVESDEHAIEVYLREFEPEIIPVNIFLPRPVSRNVAVVGEISHSHQQVDVPLAHYNSLIMKLNTSGDAAARAAGVVPEELSSVGGAQASVSSKKSRQLTGAFDREDAANDNEKAAVDPQFWIDHMLVPQPTGGVPLLPSSTELHIVSPVDDDWVETAPAPATTVARRSKAPPRSAGSTGGATAPAAAMGMATA